MEKRDKADELVNSIQSIEPMEDVPADVSARFHSTLSQLSNQEVKAPKKKSFLAGSNQFALAASFVLVFALGIVINLNSDTNVPGQVNLVETQPSGSATSSGVSAAIARSVKRVISESIKKSIISALSAN